MSTPLHVRCALLSLSDKKDAVELAQCLHEHGVSLLATGGTYRLLREAGLPLQEVAEYTGFPELLDGRVKTLHPRIHGGILARGDADAQTLAAHDIAPIELVAVNLYPFEQTVAREDCSLAEAVEQIDIGGPTLLRAAAKNHAHVAVLSSPEQYAGVLEELQNGGISAATRQRLAREAFEHTAAYDAAIRDWFAARQGKSEGEDGTRAAAADAEFFPLRFQPRFQRRQVLRYGENPHQRAAFYTQETIAHNCIATAEQLQGKALSYNNLADADAALECVRGLAVPACVIVKHANPCGAAQAATPQAAYEAAYATDPEAAFGGILAFNCTLDEETAQTVLGRQFAELIIAPEITAQARAVLATKPALRALRCGVLKAEEEAEQAVLHYHCISGGLLLQERDQGGLQPEQLQTVSRKPVDEALRDELLFAWQIARFVKSNAIVLCREHRTLGVGAGQMSRVYSVRIAALKAADLQLSLQGAVMASDAFFPFRDGIDAAAEHGIRAVIQPGGSKRDAEVIAAADEHGMAMLFTGRRHFRH